jgi:hypothetical protein
MTTHPEEQPQPQPEMIEYSGGVEWWADCYPQWKGRD